MIEVTTNVLITVVFVASYYASVIPPSSFCSDAFNSFIVSNKQTLSSGLSSTRSAPKETTNKILWLRTSSSPSSINIVDAAAREHDDGEDGTNLFRTSTFHYDTNLSSESRIAGGGQKQRKWYSRVKSSWMRRPDTSSASEGENQQSTPTYRFTYDCNEMIIDAAVAKLDDLQQTKTTTGIVLIHPIGLGIGKWYYDRLFASFSNERCNSNNTLISDRRLVILAPDLLGSATACCPTDIASGIAVTKKLPLLNITDWSGQILHLMTECESNFSSEERGFSIDNWIIVANGGCSPIALHVAASSSSTMMNQNRAACSHRAPVTNVILSSPPRLPFFLPNATISAACIDPNKVHKSYRTLSGTVGRLFWWYALRNNGTFIQKFSERNLVGNATSLGEEWTPNCIATARLHNGQSRYSTFAFLAGALQDGCAESLRMLKAGHDSNVSPTKIDFIRGTDGRRNRARSWFWTNRRKRPNGRGADTRKDRGGDGKSGNGVLSSVAEEMTIQQYVSNNGNRGKEVFVNGARISLAWENADEYAKRLLELCSDS